MRRIERSTAFKRDYRKLKRSISDLDDLLLPVLQQLVEDIPLDPALRDHALSGNWRHYRDCHLKPDLVLIYRKTDDDLLRLARLGSHSELF